MSHTKILATFLFGSFLLVDVHGMENNLKTRGLYNEGKSCWFNSSIQFLHASPSFRKLVSDINNCSKKKNASEENNSIAKHLMDLFEFLENGKNEHGTMDDFLKIDIWPKNGKLQELRSIKDCDQAGAQKLYQWANGKEDDSFFKKSPDLRRKIVGQVLAQTPKYEGTFSKDGSGHTRLFIEALIDGLEREIVDNFVRACGAQVYRNDLKNKVRGMKLRKIPVNTFKVNAESIDEYNRNNPFANKSLIEILGIPKNKVSESMNNIDSLYREFCQNVRDIVSSSKQQKMVNERFAITPWGYKEGNYDIRFDNMKEVYIENVKSEAYIEPVRSNARSKADVEKVKSSIGRVGQRNIIIQEIEDINRINNLESLEGINKLGGLKKANEDGSIVYYDLPGGYKFLLNNGDPYFSNISSVMLRYVTDSSAHTVSAVRYDKENFIFISDAIVATQKINSWIDLHRAASVFISKSYPERVHYICPERVLYDFGNENQ